MFFCFLNCIIDPSAGSPTETLLRLLLPLNYKIRTNFIRKNIAAFQKRNKFLFLSNVLKPHLETQSVGATGGVYKGQGRILDMLMTCQYKAFLVQVR